MSTVIFFGVLCVAACDQCETQTCLADIDDSILLQVKTQLTQNESAINIAHNAVLQTATEVVELSGGTADVDDPKPTSPTFRHVDIYSGPQTMIGKKGQLHSQVGQDWLVASLLGCKSSGYFLDLAANDAELLSNTLMLERDFGWNGICIEPNPAYIYGLSQRKCQVVVGAVGSKTGQEVAFNFEGGVFGGMAGPGFDNKIASANAVSLPTIELGSLLANLEAPSKIDYLSLDVEGAESIIMTGFPWEKYTFSVITVERPKLDLQNMLQQAGYRKLRVNSNFDDETWVHKTLPDIDEITAAWSNLAATWTGGFPASCMDARGYKRP